MPLELLTWYLPTLESDAGSRSASRHIQGGSVWGGTIFLHLFVHKTLVTSCHYDFEKPSLLFFLFFPPIFLSPLPPFSVSFRRSSVLLLILLLIEKL